MEEQLEGLLKLMGKTLDEVQKMRTAVLVHNLNPRVLQIPRCELLGMKVEFGDVKEPRILSVRDYYTGKNYE